MECSPLHNMGKNQAKCKQALIYSVLNIWAWVQLPQEKKKTIPTTFAKVSVFVVQQFYTTHKGCYFNMKMNACGNQSFYCKFHIKIY